MQFLTYGLAFLFLNLNEPEQEKYSSSMLHWFPLLLHNACACAVWLSNFYFPEVETIKDFEATDSFWHEVIMCPSHKHTDVTTDVLDGLISSATAKQGQQPAITSNRHPVCCKLPCLHLWHTLVALTTQFDSIFQKHYSHTLLHTLRTALWPASALETYIDSTCSEGA